MEIKQHTPETTTESKNKSKEKTTEIKRRKHMGKTTDTGLNNEFF